MSQFDNYSQSYSYYFFIGPMKTGTTWIHDYLKARGDINLPSGVKETFFFDKKFNKGLDWYFQHFENKKRTALKVEVAPSYFNSEKVPLRIENSVGNNIGITITLRDPINRSFSHYLHLKKYGFTDKTLSKAIEDFPEIIQASKYSTYIDRWISIFGDNAVSFLTIDQLKNNPLRFAEMICKQLQIPFMDIPEKLLDKKSNKSAIPTSISLAYFGQNVADVLRDKKLYSVINIAKKLGMKKVFFENFTNDEVPSLEEFHEEILNSFLKDEIKIYNKINLKLD